MKRIILTAMMGVLCATASAGDRVGLAQSRETFDISRDSAAITQRANVLNEVQAGDVVNAGLSKVTVNTSDQGSVLINERSAVEFLDEDTFRLLEGAAVFHLPEGTARAVRYDDVVITTLESSTSSRLGHVVLVSSTNEGRLQVQSIRQAFAVSQKNGEDRLATLGDGDLLIFGRNDEGGWSTIDPNQGQPTRFRLAQDAAAAPPDEEDEEDRRRGAWWIVGGALLAAAAAGGVGYLIIQELRDDDDDDDERIEERPRRRPVSPIIRPDDDRYFDDEYLRDEFVWNGQPR